MVNSIFDIVILLLIISPGFEQWIACHRAPSSEGRKVALCGIVCKRKQWKNGASPIFCLGDIEGKERLVKVHDSESAIWIAGEVIEPPAI
jgi:hypothetical protein